MISERSVESAIGFFYESVVDTEKWRTALEYTAKIIGASGAQLIIGSRDLSAVTSTEVVGFPKEAQKEYAEYYYSVDPRAALTLTRPPGYLVQDHVELPSSVITRSEFYNDYLRRYECGHVTAVRVSNKDRAVLLAFLSDVATPPIDEEGLLVLRKVIPHIQRAVDMRARIDSQVAHLQLLAETIKYAALPMFIVGAGALLSFANAAGEALLRSNQGLQLCKGLLRASSIRGTNALLSICRRIARSSFVQRGTTVHLAALTLEISPLLENGVHSGKWLIVAKEQLSSRALLQAYVVRHGLSLAESRLLMELAGGGTLKMASRALGVAPSTIKTQLASIFRKTGTCRQTELLISLLQFRPPS